MERRRPPARRPFHPPARYPTPRRFPSRRKMPPIWIWGVLIGGFLLLGISAFFLARTAIRDKSEHPLPTETSVADLVLSPTKVSTFPPTSMPAAPDIPTLQQFMHRLINETRKGAGLSEVIWDETAAVAGLRHAQEMAGFGYLSHWNLEGYGPDHRYSFAGGLDSVRENVFLYEHSPGAGPVSADEWKELIQKAHKMFMDSPGHRDNILAPEHTHLGIGIAYDPNAGRLAIAQEFVDRYVALQPLPRRASLGDTISIKGRLLANAESPFLVLAYEPTPQPMTLEALRKTGVYQSPAVVCKSSALLVNDNQFEGLISLNCNSQSGLYHIQVWVDVNGKRLLAADAIVEVR